MASKEILAAFGLVLGLSACGSLPTQYIMDKDQVIVLGGPGGYLLEKKRLYAGFKNSGKQLVIDGQVISADAYYAFSTPGACYTPNAVFSPHAVRNGMYDYERDAEITDYLASKLPPPLEEWFRASPAFYMTRSWVSADYATLVELWPEGECEPRTIAVVSMLTDRVHELMASGHDAGR